MRSICFRLSAAIACFITVFFILSACGDGGEALIPFFSGETQALDYNGRDFIIAGIYREGVTEIAPVSSDSVLGDMLIEHYNYVSKKYNINIVTVSSDNITSDIQKKAFASQKYADIADVMLSNATDLYKGNYLAYINTILDDSELYSGKYGSDSQLEAATVRKNGTAEVFGFQASYLGIPTPKYTNAGYFNSSFISTYKIPDPYELIENGQWNWENFEDICLAVISDGSDPSDDSDDTYGVAEDPDQRYVTQAAFASNGADFVTYDEAADRYLCTVDRPETYEAFDWVSEMYKSGALRVIEGTTSNTTIGNVVANFMNGYSFFLVEYTYHGITDRESISYKDDFEFSWIPFPKGPSNTDSEWRGTISWADRYYVIPVAECDEDVIAGVLPDLFSAYEGLDDYGWRDLFSNGIFFNEDSEYWFFTMFDNAKTEYNNVLTFFDEANLMPVLTGEKTASEVINSYVEVGQGEVDELMND